MIKTRSCSNQTTLLTSNKSHISKLKTKIVRTNASITKNTELDTTEKLILQLQHAKTTTNNRTWITDKKNINWVIANSKKNLRKTILSLDIKTKTNSKSTTQTKARNKIRISEKETSKTAKLRGSQAKEDNSVMGIKVEAHHEVLEVVLGVGTFKEPTDLCKNKDQTMRLQKLCKTMVDRPTIKLKLSNKIANKHKLYLQ